MFAVQQQNFFPVCSKLNEHSEPSIKNILSCQFNLFQIARIELCEIVLVYELPVRTYISHQLTLLFEDL